MKIVAFIRNNILGFLAACMLGMIVSYFTRWNVFLMLALFSVLYFLIYLLVKNIRKYFSVEKVKNDFVDYDKKNAKKVLESVNNDFITKIDD